MARMRTRIDFIGTRVRQDLEDETVATEHVNRS